MSVFTDRNDLPRFAELDAEYEILRELGRGGTAVVYLARERELGRHVAIKVIRAQYVEDPEAAARLVREARTVGGLQHPNIVVLYGTRRLRDGSLALFMQYVPGRTLKAEIATVGPLPYPRVQQILGDIGRALAHAHRHRIVHRDLKPENIYVDDDSGVARLSDFGIARPWDAESGLTLPGTAIGTPAYMSPEQIDGGALDGRSDLYSLGMIGYEMLTGSRPWAGESLFNIIYKQKHEDLPPLRSLRPDIPEPLLRAVEGTVAKSRDDRWADAHQFLAALAGGAPRRANGNGPAAAGAEPAPGRDGAASPPVPAANGSGAAGAPGGTLAAGATAGRLAPDPDPDSVTVQYRRPVEDEESLALQRDPRRRTRRVVLAAVMAIVLVGTAVSAATYPWTRWSDGPVNAPAPEPPAAAVLPSGQDQAPAATQPPALAYAVLGAEQAGVAGDTLAEPLVLRVEDMRGAALAGVAVRFEVLEGTGELVPAEGVTDDSGMLAVQYVPGAAGRHRIQALTAGGRTVSFAVTATAAGATELATLPPAAEDRASTQGTQVAGAAEEPEPDTPPSLPVRSGLVAGGTHTCLLSAAGALSCWGGNDRGQLGDGTTTRRQAAADVAVPEPVSVIATGVSHSCAIGLSGAAWCWGSNATGQLGDGTTASRPGPTRVAGDERFVAIAAGTAHTCALAAGGALFCWGQNTDGQVGDGSTTNRLRPVRVGGNRQFRSVVVGWSHTCAIGADGMTYCWGRNESGQLGDGGTTGRATPAPVAGGNTFTALAAGSGHTCGVHTNGTLMCWGGNDQGQLGIGGAGAASAPVAVRSGEPFTAVAAGGVHTCGLARDGSAFCWGRNSYGQLGDGTTDSRRVPTAVTGGLRFSRIAASGAHSCGSVTGGGWYCWGYNLDGQLGDGTATNRLRPTAVSRR
ncbi:MAG TPA: protein kinase [Longimicrobiales bacterium]|nr:protein kinase [Longimicrobiales bacterium]